MTDWEAIAAAHSASVWRTCYRLLNHYEDARDCQQETFVSALEIAMTGEVRGWRALLTRIATRRAIDRLRARYRQQQAIVARSHEVNREAVARPSESDCEELRDLIRRGLATLPAQQAEAFWLRHVEQLAVLEVAEQMSLEPGHVRVLDHRAALALRSFLGPDYGTNLKAEERK
jgi:RNA polymerase sigma factor (sigma-70 family)